MRQLASVAVVALLTLSLWPECSATAPSQAHPASLLNFRRHRTGHKREDEPQKEHVDVPPTGSDGEAAATDEVPRSIRRMQQRVLKEMFQVDILAEEDRLDHNPDVQSNYLLNLYNDIADNETGALKAMRKGKQPLLTETVGSYPILGAAQVNEHGPHWRLTFNSTDLPPVHELNSHATLAVYSRHCQPDWRRTAAGKTLRETGIHKTNVSIYASLHRHYAMPTNIAWQRLKLKGRCWHIFNVTAAVQSWQTRKKRGLRHFILQQQSYANLDVNDFLQLQGDGDPGNRPVLVLYTGKKVNIPLKASQSRRSRREASSSAATKYTDLRAPRAQADSDGDPVINSIYHRDCARRDFEIDFTKAGWHKWIISPKRYNAYRCAGACKFPIASNIRSTLHARLEASVTYQNEMLGKKDTLEGSGACCVPTAHTTMSLLFFTPHSNNRQVIRTPSKMLAIRCGCR